MAYQRRKKLCHEILRGEELIGYVMQVAGRSWSSWQISDPGVLCRIGEGSHFEHACEAVARKCRVCGCTDSRCCLSATGPCRWVSGDLCSACGPEELPGG